MTTPIETLNKKNFEIFEKQFNAHWILSGFSSRGFVHDFPKFGAGEHIKDYISIMDNGVDNMVFDSDEYDKSASHISNKLTNDDVWRENLYSKFDDHAEKYFIAGERLKGLELEKLSGNELVKEIDSILPLHYHVRVLGALLNGIITDGRNHLSNKIRNELTQHIPKEDFDKYWSILTQVTKMSMRQEKDFKIAVLAEQSKNMSKSGITKELKKLHVQYCWLDYMYLGPPSSLEKFEIELNDAIKYNRYINLQNELASIKKEQLELMDKLRLNDRARFLIKLAQHVIWQKAYRKDVEYHAFYCYERLFRELAERKGESDWRVFAYLFPWELKNFILNYQPTIDELKERRKFSCLLVNKEGYKLYIRNEAREIYKKLNLERDLSGMIETKGQCAYAGKAKGKVKIIHTPDEMDKMEDGDVIISQATSPDILPAMIKARAIVTNTGGLICHAAIIARELKIPCIVGTSNATMIFKDGDIVEVDAEKGIIKKIQQS